MNSSFFLKKSYYLSSLKRLWLCVVWWEVLMLSNQHDGMVGLSSSTKLKSQAMGHLDGICVENVFTHWIYLYMIYICNHMYKWIWIWKVDHKFGTIFDFESHPQKHDYIQKNYTVYREIHGKALSRPQHRTHPGKGNNKRNGSQQNNSKTLCWVN